MVEGRVRKRAPSKVGGERVGTRGGLVIVQPCRTEKECSRGQRRGVCGRAVRAGCKTLAQDQVPGLDYFFVEKDPWSFQAVC